MILPAIVVALALGAFVFLLLPRARPWQRAVLAMLVVVATGVAYSGSIEMMSRPKPWRLEWHEMAKAKVLGADMREGQAIYVWLKVDHAAEPRAYVLPWSTDTARQLQTAMREAENSGAQVQMSMLPDPDTAKTEPSFHAQPPLGPPGRLEIRPRLANK